MIAGLVLPQRTAADPDMQSEGRLDPLGLAGIADELAEQIARSVTARMSRPRFLTAMAVGASVTDTFADEIGLDGHTTPALAFEWHVLDAFARAGDLPGEATRGVPGISKARMTRRAGLAMSADRYLKTPKVFGFNGVYKRLANDIQIVASDFTLEENGISLVRTWERAEGLKGFSDRQPGSPGGELASNLERAVVQALEKGHLAARLGRFSSLSQRLRLDGARRREKALVWGWVGDPDVPMRMELIDRLRGCPHDLGERDSIKWLLKAKPSISRALAERFRAIEAYEEFAALLMGVFEAARFESTTRGHMATSPTDISQNVLVGKAALSITNAFHKAEDRLATVDLDGRLVAEFNEFEGERDPEAVLELCMARHVAVQRRKPPAGKRSWFDDLPNGYHVRVGYECWEAPVPRQDYLHPYRISTMRSFVQDLS